MTDKGLKFYHRFYAFNLIYGTIEIVKAIIL